MKSILCLLAVAGVAVAADNTPSNPQPNVQGGAPEMSTAQDQGNSPEDRDTTQKIRSALMKNDQLSMTAKNIKVITNNGQVTLRGPVNSPDEKNSVGAIAEGIAGKDKVSNETEVNQ